jgi:predicted metallopeptidase
MPKFIDWEVTPEVNGIMDSIIDRYPGMFSFFDTSKIRTVVTKGKTSNAAIKIHPVKYPFSTMIDDKVYIFEVCEAIWKDFDHKRKNLAVFHCMCHLPEGAFDEGSKDYARLKKHDYEIFMEEYSVAGVPNWIENDSANDFLDVSNDEKEDIERKPVTMDHIASIGEEAPLAEAVG